MKRLSLFLLLAFCAPSVYSAMPQVPQWQPYDFAFKSSTNYDNPFKADFTAVVTAPDGRKFKTLGFYDSVGTWKIRVAGNVLGKWTLQTQSEDPALHGKSASFECIPNTNQNVHGSLKVDPEHHHCFVYEDGTRYFLMGYECDWLWALDMNDEKLTRLNAFLDKIAAHRFNHIIINAYAHDCDWRRGQSEKDDFGPPAMYAWQGSNKKPDHSRFNPAYWNHYDKVIQAMYERGIVAHIMIKVYNKMVRWPKKAGAEDDMFFRWMVARYAAYPNIVWDFSKEAHNEDDLEYKLSRFRLIRDTDPYNRLLTNHDDDTAYNRGVYNSLLDFRSDQQHDDWREVILRQRKQNRWPVVNVEFGYEWGLKGKDDKTYEVVQSPEELCRRAWEICMAGGGIVYYFTNTAWDVIHPQDTPPGYKYFKNLHEFFAKTQYWRMEPADIASDGYCLTNPGSEYIVFLNKAKRFTLNVGALDQPLWAQWFNPFTGRTVDVGLIEKDNVNLTPPKAWGNGPVVFFVTGKRNK